MAAGEQQIVEIGKRAVAAIPADKVHRQCVLSEAAQKRRRKIVKGSENGNSVLKTILDLVGKAEAFRNRRSADEDDFGVARRGLHRYSRVDALGCQGLSHRTRQPTIGLAGTNQNRRHVPPPSHGEPCPCKYCV